MLTIQPKLLNTYRPAFKSNEEINIPSNEDEMNFDLAGLDEDSYNSIQKDLKESKKDLENLADNKEFNLPKPVKTAVKGGAVVTTGLIGGMATGWGTKQSMHGLSKLFKTKPMLAIKNHLKEVAKFVKESSKTIKTKFLESEAYTKPTKWISEKWAKLGESKFGKPIVNTIESIGKGIAKVYNVIKSGVKYVVDKIKGVKTETWKSATVNTVGVSGGLASGVTALKEAEDKK